MKTAQQNIAAAPASCFIVIKGNTPGQRVGIVRAGESGYLATTSTTGADDPSMTEAQVIELVNYFNHCLNVTPQQAAAAMIGSMFGWHCQGADPEHPANAAGFTAD